MKLSTNFLKDYIDIDVNVKQLAEDMTRVGNEYDSASNLINATKLVIGQITECEPHPDSDHLHLCKVNIGTEVLDISKYFKCENRFLIQNHEMDIFIPNLNVGIEYDGRYYHPKSSESKEIRNYIEEDKFMMFDYTGVYSVKDFMQLGDKAVLIAKKLNEIVPEELLRSIA